MVLGMGRQRTLTDVEVDEQHFLVGLGERSGQVARHEGLTGGCTERAERDNFQLLALHFHEVHVGAHDAECLGNDVTTVGEHHNAALVVLLEMLLGYLAEEGHVGGILDVLAVLDAGVEEEEEQQDGGRQGQTGQNALHHHLPLDGIDRVLAGMSRLQHAGIRLGGGQAEGILLTLVEQVEVKLLLDVLLALDGEHLALLARDGSHTGAGLTGTAADVLQLHLGAQIEVVDRCDDALAHGRQGLVHVFHHGVLVATALKELVALELHGVVVANLILDGSIGNARIRGDEVGFLAGIVEVALDIAAHLLLHEQVFYLGGVALALTQRCAGGRVDVDQSVGLLIVLYLLFHTAQLLLDDDESLVDEVGGVDGHLVLVLDVLFIVDGDNHVEHIGGTLRRLVL